MRQLPSSPDQTSPCDISYAYKASLIGDSQQFALTPDGLSWRIGARQSVWPYAAIAAIGLSYRPVSMQSRRFRADIIKRSGERIAILSTTWQTIALMTPQDESYRRFIIALHRRLASEGGMIALSGGMRPIAFVLSAVALGLVAAAIAGLLMHAVAAGAGAAALFLVACGALLGWQVGRFMWRNKPCTYTLDTLPSDLLP